jgi:DNA-binding PucR family transcriptional regulator
LHLHRSSLIYRLDRIARLLGRDVDDPGHSRELWLALRMRRILRRA